MKIKVLLFHNFLVKALSAGLTRLSLGNPLSMANLSVPHFNFFETLTFGSSRPEVFFATLLKLHFGVGVPL